MPEQTNNVSSGLSPLLKVAKSGRADLTASAETPPLKGSGFSSDLDKARQQQFEKANVEPEPRGIRKEGGQVSPASGVMNALSTANTGLVSRSDESVLSSESLVDVTGERDAIGKPIVIEMDDSSEIDDSPTSLLSVTNQPLTDLTDQSVAVPDELPTTLASLTPVMTEKETPETTLGLPAAVLTATPGALKDTPAPTAAVTAAPTAKPGIPTELPTTPKTNTVVPVTTPVNAQVLEQQSAKPIPVVPQEALELRALAKNTGVSKGSVGEVVSQATLTGRPTQLTSGLDTTIADDGVVAPSVLSADEGLNANTGRLLKEQSFGFTVSRTAVEHSAETTDAATLSKGRFAVSGQGAVAAVTTAPETLVTDTTVPQKNAVELTQLASGNGIVTRATLAGRFHQLNREASTTGAKTPQAATATGLTKAVLPGPSAGVTERLAVGDMPAPLVNDSLPVMEPQVGAADATPTVQQRIAATEAMLSQMAQEAGDVAVKVSTADNLLAAATGGAVTTAAVQPSVSAASPIVQAPLNIDLTSADAETALAGNVKWMTNEGLKNAVMTVTPHGMGPISVKIGIDGDQMDVSIIASQHSTRDALESMLPRLREQLAVQGHETLKVDVSDGKNEQSRTGNGQTFAESRNPAGASPQDNPSNSRNHDDKTEYGRSDNPDSSELLSDSLMAEDLQRVAARAIGEAGSRSVFDAYV